MPNIMAEDFEDGMSLREEVDANLSDASVERLRELIGARRAPHLFKERLVHFLIRYERYLAATPKVTRNERREQLSRLHEKTKGFLFALDALDAEVAEDISMQLNTLTHESRWKDFDFFNPDHAWPADDDSLASAKCSGTNILEACRAELAILDATKGVKKGSANPALDQMLIDLAALYETETGHSAKSHCYRDVTVEDEFNGKFFLMVKGFLGEFVPESFETSIALGKRILRVLKDD